MALLLHLSSSPSIPHISAPNPNPRGRFPLLKLQCLASPTRGRERLDVDSDFLSLAEAASDGELWASVRLRTRTFYEFKQSVGVEDHSMSLAEREFEALKDRIGGNSNGFRRVACINATLPLSLSLACASDLCSSCKFTKNGEDHVVVGTLDINQCLRLADELTGKKPEGIGADMTRAYLSNVCVAEELQRNGLGFSLIRKSKMVAQSWGITDLYVHVAADNEAAKKLYEKTGFTYEDEEPAWQARFLGRPKRLILWSDLAKASNMWTMFFLLMRRNNSKYENRQELTSKLI